MNRKLSQIALCLGLFWGLAGTTTEAFAQGNSDFGLANGNRNGNKNGNANGNNQDDDVVSAPEPCTMLILGSMAGAGYVANRRRKKKELDGEDNAI